jgi:replicative DNA helicase
MRERRNIDMLGLGKIPPQAVDVEEVVLGALLLDKDALDKVMGTLQPEVFYKEQHKRIFSAMKTLYSKGLPVELITVPHQLKKDGTLELSGGPFYLTKLAERISSAANIEYHATVLLEKYIARELIRVSGEINNDAFDDSQDCMELLVRARKDIEGIERLYEVGSTSSFDDQIKQTVRALDHRIKLAKNKQLEGVKTLLPEIDHKTNGWKGGKLIVVAARPGMGKTQFGVLSAKIAAEEGDGVAVFSSEMTAREIIDRMVAQGLSYNQTIYNKGWVTNEQHTEALSVLGRVEKLPVFIDDVPGINLIRIQTISRKLKRDGVRGKPLKMIVIDYLQLMAILQLPGETRDMAIGSVTRQLKQLAKELNVPIILLSQLNRGLEKRGGDKEPLLSDLRESGAIEQDADIVVFIHRPEEYGQDETKIGGEYVDSKNIIKFIFAKIRESDLGAVFARKSDDFSKIMPYSIASEGLGYEDQQPTF